MSATGITHTAALFLVLAMQPRVSRCAESGNTVPGSGKYEKFLTSLDLGRVGLGKVKEAATQGAHKKAMQELLAHYRNRKIKYHFDVDAPLAKNLGKRPPGQGFTSSLEELMRREYTCHGKTIRVGEKMNWNMGRGEWRCDLLRHAFLPKLVEGYRRLGREDCMAEFAALLKAWDRQVPVEKSGQSIDVGLRLARWVRVFPVAVQSKHFDIVLLEQFLRRMHAACERIGGTGGYHSGNFGTFAAMGVAQAGIYFPEFKRAGDWTYHALKRLLSNRTFEQSSGYHEHVVSMNHRAVKLIRDSGYRLPERLKPLHERFFEQMDGMLDWSAAVTRPDLSMVQFGDADATDMRPRLLNWGRMFKRPDLVWMATEGKEGEKPAWRDRVFDKRRGNVVLRGPWEQGKDTCWLFFAFDKTGGGHSHCDYLGVDLYGFGRPLIVDPGRFTYGGKWRTRFTSLPYHNSICLDGRNVLKRPSARLARRKLSGRLKVLHAWHDGYTKPGRKAQGNRPAIPPGPPVICERQVLMIRDRFWVIADLVRAEDAHACAQNWHFMPTTLKPLKPFAGFVTGYPEANIAIIPLAGKAESRPLEGWYSVDYGAKEKAPWLSFQAQTDKGWLFVTLLAPFPGKQCPLEERQVKTSGNGADVVLKWRGGIEDRIEVSFGEKKGTGYCSWTGQNVREELK